MFNRKGCIGVLLFSAGLPFVVGCEARGDLGTVTGKVVADGKPLANALISYYPKEGGRASQGRTTADGSYELILDRETMGAQVGWHEVRISTAGVPTGDYGKSSPETLPAKFNVASKLVADVKPGKNEINFTVDYEGKIIQPDQY